ncbi:lipid-transfer protein DIR1 [Carex littledalei]|uniref:Lipid-transfer protein DIR1 n=1 Tax=Carex littledalei TaxID=544730 RepID=A0A833QW99_9POAL|nr:lipid-transfer protein DIR1 [Carex littledalei]
MEFQPSFKLAFLSILLLCFAVNNSMVSAFSLCGMNNDGITTCLPSVRGSNPPHPTPKCCRAARRANFKCFCSYQHSVLIRLLGVNVDQIRKLPAKCDVLHVVCFAQIIRGRRAQAKRRRKNELLVLENKTPYNGKRDMRRCEVKSDSQFHTENDNQIN